MNPEIALTITNASDSQTKNEAAIETYLTAFVERLLPDDNPEARELSKSMIRLLIIEQEFCDLIAEGVGLRRLLASLPAV